MLVWQYIFCHVELIAFRIVNDLIYIGTFLILILQI